MSEEANKEQPKDPEQEKITELSDVQLEEAAGGSPDGVPSLETDKSEQITKVGRPGYIDDL